MKTKLLALDLDGTTLTSNHDILPEVRKAIHSVKDDIKVILVTGRHHTTVKPYHSLLELDTPVICCNGTYIYDFSNDQVLVENSISKTHAHEFIRLANQHNLKLVMHSTHAMSYLYKDTLHDMDKIRVWANSFPEATRPMVQQLSNFEQELLQSDYIWKFLAIGDLDNIKVFCNTPFISNYFSCEQSWKNRMDFVAKGNSKGARLAEYLNLVGISPEEVIAVGDHHNDISMITLAGLGVAMTHSDDAVKSVADVISVYDNNESGIAHIIRNYITG